MKGAQPRRELDSGGRRKWERLWELSRQRALNATQTATIAVAAFVSGQTLHVRPAPSLPDVNAPFDQFFLYLLPLLSQHQLAAAPLLSKLFPSSRTHENMARCLRPRRTRTRQRWAGSACRVRSTLHWITHQITCPYQYSNSKLCIHLHCCWAIFKITCPCL